LGAQLQFNLCKKTGVKLGNEPLVWTCTKISRNWSWRSSTHVIK